MQFHEKLIFLMDLTHLSSKALAEAIHVAPSMISLLRTGRRGRPQNHEHLQNMAAVFSENCNSDYQRKGLADAMGIGGGFSATPRETLESYILSWLMDENISRIQTSRLMHALSDSPDFLSVIPEMPATSSGKSLYYGTEGKTDALYHLYNYLIQLKEPVDIYVSSDENTSWFSSSNSASERIMAWEKHLLQKGFHYVQVFPNISNSGQSFEELLSLLPYLIRGQMEGFFYPRFRDNLYRCTVVVVPDHICLASFSLAMDEESVFTIVSSDSMLIHAQNIFFQKLISLCRPVLETFDSTLDMYTLLSQMQDQHTWLTRKRYSLSPETMSAELHSFLLCETGHSDAIPDAAHFQEQSISHNRYCVDIIGLASATQIQSGLVPILCGDIGFDKPIYYTPVLYVSHLKQIVFLLLNEPTYHCILQPFRLSDTDSYMVTEDMLLVSHFYPYKLFRVTHPSLMQVLQEDVMRIRDGSGFGIGRQQLVATLTALIEELESLPQEESKI